jgi:hypothetical protein
MVLPVPLVNYTRPVFKYGKYINCSLLSSLLIRSDFLNPATGRINLISAASARFHWFIIKSPAFRPIKQRGHTVLKTSILLSLPKYYICGTTQIFKICEFHIEVFECRSPILQSKLFTCSTALSAVWIFALTRVFLWKAKIFVLFFDVREVSTLK